MARHGLSKVKTGCITCKIRRVKCDEARPACNRCVSTGRKCDGYVAPPNGTYSWAQLLRVCPPPTQNASESELRALSFFRGVVAPVLAGPLDNYFWTHLATQLSHQEQAAKYAVLTISSLYEKFKENPMDRLAGEKNLFAVSNYNEAIRHLRTTDNPETVLFVCLLFVCVDMLRGECKGAIEHCRHGINILNASRSKSKFIRDHLEPAFCRLGVFPFFFGVRPETFPAMEIGKPVPHAPYKTLAEAQAALDPLLVRTIRFVRTADEYRLGDETSPKPGPLVMQDRKELDEALDSWDAAFRLYRGEKAALNADCMSERDVLIIQLLEMKWIVGKIWIDTCLSRGETIFDLHLDKFQRIIDIAHETDILLRSSHEKHPRAKFTFEMGFAPLLGFVVVKCRSLRLRVAALKLVRTISHERESLWDNSTLLSLGRVLLKVENDVHLRCDDDLEDIVDDGTLPPEGMRIKDSAMQKEARIVPGSDGSVTVWKKVGLLMRELDGPITIREEWFEVPMRRKP
ncbi:Aspercryptin biosynthesis cluster-specific transcription regulator atnN [Colletotrichum siamense]|uniref:Aspercryptin biosynthesis cluster-specific transcription regulator atnN n=1 Tax=Colletotrichum siamense TaxID=690259 RepID=A0A9P5K2Y6_COLSI|nr:Aspercryptin biosynthesis cluster-specific transcription regulator atnN [Colletotrichum siamense]KAF4854725.1 Aspercryptin biosynthesis cluster-specific transcription regulator atnN [Colletotrichum siamense]